MGKYTQPWLRPAAVTASTPTLLTLSTHVAVLLMIAGDFVLQMPPQSPRSQLEIITGESDPHTSPRRGGITRLTVDVPSARHTPGETRPSRWRTPEFFLYYAIFVTVVPWMVYVPVQLSSSAYCLAVFPPACRPYSIRFFSETYPNYDLYRHRLASGWFPDTEIVSLVP